MQPVLIKAIGGLMVSVIMIFNINSSLINNTKYEINQDIEELIESYEIYEDDFKEVWIDNNLEWIVIEQDGKLTKEDIDEMRDEALQSFIYNQIDNENISDISLDYMKKQLPEHIQNFIDRKYKATGESEKQEICRFYIKNKVLNDDIEWLGGK